MRVRFSIFVALVWGILLFLTLRVSFTRSSETEITTSSLSDLLQSSSGLPSIEFVSSVGGAISSVTISNTTAYVGEGAALVILDVSNPFQTLQQSRLPLPDLVGNIQVMGDLAYVANHYSGLQIIDIHDPTNPILLGSYDTPGMAVEVLVVDGIAYVADGDSGLQIVNAKSPNSPEILGTYETDGFANNIQMTEGLVYLGHLNEGLYILNVDIPTKPQLLSHLPLMSARDIQIVDDIAYMAGGEFALGILDVSNPVSPTLLINYRNGVESAKAVKVNNGIAYVTTFGSLQTVDVSDPTKPAGLGMIYEGNILDITINGRFVYVANYYEGLKIFDVSEATTILPTGQYKTQGSASTIQVVDNVAYVADSFQGLQVIDISNPTKPIWLSYAEGSRSAFDLAISGDLVYLANGNQGMQIFDVTIPISPTLVGVFPGAAYRIELNDDIAYIGGNGGIQILDISDPISPVIRSSYSGVRSSNIVTEKNVAYGIDPTGFQVIDIENPDSPKLLGQYMLSNASEIPGDMAVLGDFVYLTIDPIGLQIIDVREPASPALLSTYDFYSGIVEVQDGYIFTTSGLGFRKMHVLDANNPSAPKPRATYTLPDSFRGLEIIDNLIFVAGGIGGIQILHIYPARFPPDLYLPLVTKML